MNDSPAWLTATLASDATEGQGVLPNIILPLLANSRVVGPAQVLMMSRDDNLAVREFLDAGPEAGCVVVAAGGSASRTATIGGLLALEMRQAGIVGLVTDGLVRDAREIRELSFPVWCRGVTPIASQKNGPALVRGSVSIGGVVVRDGDLVIADDDGVVVWPQERINDLLTRAQKKLEQDNKRLEEIQKKGMPPV